MCAAKNVIKSTRKLNRENNECPDLKSGITERMWLFWLAYIFSNSVGTHKVSKTYTFFNFYFPIITMERKGLIISKAFM